MFQTSPQYCNPSPLQTDQQQATEMRRLGQIVNCPSNTTSTPYMNENNLHKEETNLKADMDSSTDISSQHL